MRSVQIDVLVKKRLHRDLSMSKNMWDLSWANIGFAANIGISTSIIKQFK